MPDDIRPTTLSFCVPAIEKSWLSPAACIDFGIDSPAHFEALARPFVNDEITMRQLDAALGHGAKLTALANAAPSNPHKGIRFQTSWDITFGRCNSSAPATDPPTLEQEAHRASPRGLPGPRR